MSDTAADGTVQTRRAPLGRPGFSLVELLFVILLIFLLMGLLLGAIHFVTKQARGAADGAAANALKSSVSQFSQTFSFQPPLVMDMGPPATFTGGPLVTVSGEQRPQVYVVSNSAQQLFLRTAPAAGSMDMRFSIYSLPYYVLGVLDGPRNAAATVAVPIDGRAGPGFRSPRRDGTFEAAGRTFDPFFDLKGNAHAVVQTALGTGRIELRDSHGVAFRYYRWAIGHEYVSGSGNFEVKTVADLNVPWMVGDPNTNPDLKNANYAILAAGPNGVFGDEDLLPLNHPQRMALADMAIKLGISADTTTAPGIQKVRDAAMSDNIVVIGVEVNR